VNGRSWRPPLSFVVMALLLALVSGCGEPVPESKNLPSLTTSSAVLDRTLVAFLVSDVERSQVRSLADQIAVHDGVGAWGVRAAASNALLQQALGNLETLGQFLPTEGGNAHPAVFVVRASDTAAQDALLKWLATLRQVHSVVYWADGSPRLKPGA